LIRVLEPLAVLRESLAPRYDVEREIGVGGMARVYLAVERHPSSRESLRDYPPFQELLKPKG
jgi:hypothetical protein